MQFSANLLQDAACSGAAGFLKCNPALDESSAPFSKGYSNIIIFLEKVLEPLNRLGLRARWIGTFKPQKAKE